MSRKTMRKSLMTVKRITETRDDGGGRVETEQTVADKVHCGIDSRAGLERFLTGREGVVSSHRVYYAPGDVDLREKDIILIGSETYDVDYVDDVKLAGNQGQADVTLRK